MSCDLISLQTESGVHFKEKKTKKHLQCQSRCVETNPPISGSQTMAFKQLMLPLVVHDFFFFQIAWAKSAVVTLN